MLHQFLRNLSNNILGVLLCAPLFLLPHNLYAQKKMPGFFQSFESIVKIQKENYAEQVKKASSSQLDINSIKDIKTVSLNVDFLSSLIFNSPSRYIAIANKDKCSLYDLMTTDLLKTLNAELEFVIIDYKDLKNKDKSAAMKLPAFLQQIAYIQCPKVANLKAYFKPKNLRNTLKSINLKIPHNYDQCFEIHNQFLDDYKTPHLCNLVEKIRKLPKLKRTLLSTPKTTRRKYNKLQKQVKEAISYKKIIKKESLHYLNNLCLNISSPQKYCKNFFEVNFWKRAVEQNTNQSVLSTYCSSIIKNYKGSERQKKICTKKITRNKELCIYSDNDSLSPKSNCADISNALGQSRLFRDYTDCPAQTGNEGITSFARYHNHYSKAAPEAPTKCNVTSVLPFTSFALENMNPKGTVPTVCYKSELVSNQTCIGGGEEGSDDKSDCSQKISTKDICLPFIYGASKNNNKLNITSVFETILKKRKGFTGTCKVITTKEYKPQLLRYKAGCYIIFNTKNCSGLDCKFKVTFDQTPFSDFRIKNTINYDFVPSNFIDRAKSLVETYYRINNKSYKLVKNISDIKRVFKNKNTIILGLGCLEELLPSFFQSKHINTCTPTPFIVDGIKSKDGLYSLIIRTSLDHIHAPRVTPWSYVFASLRSFQEYSPLRTWGFYAIQ